MVIIETRNVDGIQFWNHMSQEINDGTTVKAILYLSFIDNAAIKYGRENEKVAKKELAFKLKKEVKSCRLFIDNENPCLGASPDGLIDDNGLVEINVLYRLKILQLKKLLRHCVL